MGKKTRSRGVYRGKKQAKTARSSTADDDPMYDKVDQFMMGSDQVDLDDSDVDVDDSDVPQRVMQLSHEQDSSSDEDDLDDSSSDEEEKQKVQQRHKRQDEKYEEWGRLSGRHTYHGNDVETNREGYDAAVQEEEEAKYLQEKQAAEMDEADFAVEEASESESDDEFWDEAAQKEEFQKAAKAIEDVSLDPESMSLASGAKSSSGKKLSKAEKRKLLEQDAPELIGLLKDFDSKLGDLKNNVQPLLTQAMKRDLPTSEGISFLEAKFHLLLNYCMNIGFYMLMKAEGKQVRDHPVISQLVKLRLLLDKIKPVDQKLHYQVQKLLKMSETGQVDEATTEALQHRPNLDALDDDEDEDAATGVYKIKKVAPTVYQTESVEKKKKDRQRKLKTGTAMSEFIREEFSEAPQEISFTGRPKMSKEQKQEVDFEEDNFMRLTRQAKARRKQEKELLQRSELEDPLDFRDITGFGQLSDEDEDDRTSREKLSAIVNRVGQEGTSYNPEVDLPYEGWEKRKPLQKRSLRDFQKSDEDDSEEEPYGHPMNAPEDMEDDDDDEVSEDEYYTQMEQATKKRKLDATRESQLPDYYDESLRPGSKRGVTYQIEHNKGLTRHRPKKMRNPRVRYKLKAEKAAKKLKTTGHRSVKDQLAPYGGESSGIRKGVKRSVNLGK